jgi:hypothetical protein
LRPPNPKVAGKQFITATATKDLHATIRISHALAMFVISEADAATIRTAYEQRGEFSAAVELRQLFPGITDNAQARECVRTIADWRPLPKRLRPARLRHGNT